MSLKYCLIINGSVLFHAITITLSEPTELFSLNYITTAALESTPINKIYAQVIGDFTAYDFGTTTGLYKVGPELVDFGIRPTGRICKQNMAFETFDKMKEMTEMTEQEDRNLLKKIKELKLAQTRNDPIKFFYKVISIILLRW